MGYAHYDTPLGPAGYAVDDVCHDETCTQVIDRGLSYLCGGNPGRPDEMGCGHWFCGRHLFYVLDRDHPETSQLCRPCRDKHGADEDDE